MRYGINGSGRLITHGIEGVLTGIDEAEADGFSSFWVAQVGITDALTTIAAHGDTGSSMQIGTAVVSTWERHPHMLAAQALTTQTLIGDRLVLGIGLSHEPHVTQVMHERWHKPVRHMLDYLDILDDVFSTGGSNHRGEIWSWTDGVEQPTPPRPQVMIAALGEQMLKVAGRRTDGTILWCVGAKTIATHIAPVINDAAAAADRPTPSIVCSLPVWVTDDPQPARDFLAAVLSNYAELPSYRAMLDIEGVHGLGDLSIVGSAQYVRDRIGEIAASGATDFTAVPMGANPDEEAATMDVLRDALRAG